MLYSRGKAGESSRIRITPELDELIQRVAERLPGDDRGNESTVVRRVVIGIERGRVVEGKEISNSLYKSGKVVKNYAFALPDMSHDEFRRRLALRLLEELENRPARRKLPREAKYLAMVEEEDGTILGVWDRKYVKRELAKK